MKDCGLHCNVHVRSQSGFSLLEILTALSVAAISLGFAVPSLQTFSANNQVLTANNSIVTGMNIARSTAVSTGRQVSICSTIDGEACSNAGWNKGWIVFIDADGDGDATSNEIVRVAELDNDVTLLANQGAITFRPDGTTSLASTAAIGLCYGDLSVTSDCRQVSVSAFGMIESIASESVASVTG